MQIALLVGSLRKDSHTRRIAREIADRAPKSMSFTEIPIGHLPLYNQDLDPDSPPREWVEFRDRVRGVDGVLFATPEYNRSVPGVLKNAIDVGSRPYGKSVWQKKPAAVLSASTGALGGFGANHHLRQSLVFLDMPCLQQPEMYIGNAAKLWEGGTLDEKIGELFTKFAQAFHDWVAQFSDRRAAQDSAA